MVSSSPVSITVLSIPSAFSFVMAARLSGWTLPVVGVQDFDQAQVTAGGASLKDFDTRSMGSLRAPGLFAAGEVLDVDGDCGGFNLQWAWSSALLAAQGIDARLSGWEARA